MSNYKFLIGPLVEKMDDARREAEAALDQSEARAGVGVETAVIARLLYALVLAVLALAAATALQGRER